MSEAILEQALAYLKREVPCFEDIRVESVCLGCGYTGVWLSTGDVGLCHSLLGEVPGVLPNSEAVGHIGW
jgi:uncharacterized protein (DUF4213/DUF364 family)